MRRSDTHAELMTKWKESHRTGMICNCQSIRTDAKNCPVHGHLWRKP